MKKTDYDRTKVKLVLISCVICIVIIIFLLVLRGCCQDKKIFNSIQFVRHCLKRQYPFTFKRGIAQSASEKAGRLYVYCSGSFRRYHRNKR